jgi:hypothetical protein
VPLNDTVALLNASAAKQDRALLVMCLARKCTFLSSLLSDHEDGEQLGQAGVKATARPDSLT